MIYLKSKKFQKEDRAKVISLFQNQEGVAQIIEPRDFKKWGYPMPEKNPQMADLVLVAKDGFSFVDDSDGGEIIRPARTDGTFRGSHGYLSDNPQMDALLLVWGNKIPRGKTIGVIENIDLAPTAAYLFGEKFPHSDGKIRREIFLPD